MKGGEEEVEEWKEGNRVRGGEKSEKGEREGERGRERRSHDQQINLKGREKERERDK